MINILFIDRQNNSYKICCKCCCCSVSDTGVSVRGQQTAQTGHSQHCIQDWTQYVAEFLFSQLLKLHNCEIVRPHSVSIFL